MKLSISAVVITKNEAHRIRRCLDSVKGWVSEIIVVDDGSTDETREISQNEYDALIIPNPSECNFDRQRNLGIDRASSEWILQMDADEVYPQETAIAIQNAVRTNTDYSAFSLIRREYVLGYWLQHVQNPPMIKIFKKDKGRYVSRKVHEVLKIDGKAGEIKAFVDHYNMASISETFDKYNKYTDKESSVQIEETVAISGREIRRRLLYKTVKTFYKHYWKEGGHKDGIYGLIWAMMNTIHPAMHWLKVTEKAIAENKIIVL